MRRGSWVRQNTSTAPRCCKSVEKLKDGRTSYYISRTYTHVIIQCHNLNVDCSSVRAARRKIGKRTTCGLATDYDNMMRWALGRGKMRQHFSWAANAARATKFRRHYIFFTLSQVPRRESDKVFPREILRRSPPTHTPVSLTPMPARVVIQWVERTYYPVFNHLPRTKRGKSDLGGESLWQRTTHGTSACGREEDRVVVTYARYSYEGIFCCIK